MSYCQPIYNYESEACPCIGILEHFFELLEPHRIFGVFICDGDDNCEFGTFDEIIDNTRYDGCVFYNTYDNNLFTKDSHIGYTEMKVCLECTLLNKDYTDDEFSAYIDKITKIADQNGIRVKGLNVEKMLEVYIPTCKNNI